MEFTIREKELSKYPRASFREFVSLSFPLIFSLLSSYLLLVVDRLFLSHYSLSAFEACAAAANLYFFFQMLLNRFISTIQAFVGKAFGEKQMDEAYSYTWQMIWLSLASPFILFPIGFFFGKAFFSGTLIYQESLTYLSYLLAGSLFMALEATLSSYYAGVGETKRIFKVHLVSHTVNILLNYLLIFGTFSLIPPLGIHGAALGTLISKGLSCYLLGRHFFRLIPKIFRPIPHKLKACLQKALPRAIGQGVAVLSWNLAARLVMGRSSAGLLCVTFGTTIYLPLVNEAAGSAILTLTSYIIGSKKWHLFPKMLRSAAIFLGCNALLLSVPLMLFPETLISLFFAHAPNGLKPLLISTSHMIYLNFVLNSIYIISFMLITALQDMKFYLIAHTVLCPLSLYLPTYLLLQSRSWSPETFWLLTALQAPLFFLIYFPRSLSRLKQMQLHPNPLI